MATQIAAAGASIIGSILGGKGQKKAAKKAAAIQADASREANTLTRDIYNTNVSHLSPYMATGQTANNAFMELLGFGGPAQPNAFGAPSGFATPAFGDGTVAAEPPTARSAFDTYRGSTGYDFRFNEGTRALQSAFSRNLESGAASKAAIRFGQGIGSDEFARYMDLLQGQARLGFGSASALTGVGQNFGDTINSSNRAAADAASNARLYAGQVNGQMWQGLGSSFGQLASAFPGGGVSKFKVGGW